MHPFWSKVLFWCINFAAKVFSGYTHFEKKFSLDPPILSVHGRLENSPPQIPQQQQEEEEEEHFPLPDLSAAPQIKRSVGKSFQGAEN